MPKPPTPSTAPSVVLDLGDEGRWLLLKSHDALAVDGANTLADLLAREQNAPVLAFVLETPDARTVATLLIATTGEHTHLLRREFAENAAAMRIVERAALVLAPRVMASDDPSQPLADGPHAPPPGRPILSIRTRDGLLDGGDHPAVVSNMGEKRWMREGLLHRDENPAVTTPGGGEEWWRRGILHRDAGPAIAKEGGQVEYYVEGKHHRDPFEENWTRIGLALAHAAFRANHCVTDNGNEQQVSRRYTKERLLLQKWLKQADIRDWNDKAQSLLNGWRLDGAGGAPKPDDVLRARLHRFAFLLARGDFAPISVPDRAALADLLKHTPAGREPEILANAYNGLARKIPREESLSWLSDRLGTAAAPVPPPADPDSPIAFAFTWQAAAARGRKAATGRATGAASAFERIEADDAPVFAALASPEGGTLDLRHVDGVPYRPVLSPGSWRPCTEAEFRAAAAEGVAWADNPFKENPRRATCPRSVPEEGVASIPSRPGDAEARDRALADALVRAGRLVSIDGIVHRQTSEPALCLVATHLVDGEETQRIAALRYELAWRLADGLAMTHDQRTILPRSARVTQMDDPLVFAATGFHAFEASEPAAVLTFGPSETRRANLVMAALSEVVSASHRRAETLIQMPNAPQDDPLRAVDAVPAVAHWLGVNRVRDITIYSVVDAAGHLAAALASGNEAQIEADTNALDDLAASLARKPHRSFTQALLVGLMRGAADAVRQRQTLDEDDTAAFGFL